ncbi:hypothetical protein MMYC01_208611 [Madurella mycetomatis]|uniref:F-box domain-containing protein n=1 Tax=Madurella mycetomatis TaxID=100816 RepID=A0A175VSF6_9PEZI|nr:hypothetical protein MMYC01_208611 [Madurella mycetomatis]
MGIDNIPLEVLGIIIGYLLLPEGQSDSGLDVELDDLRNARLVCRRWNSVASTHMFRNVALLHTPDGEDFTKFKQLVASSTVQHAARCVEIYSAPHHYPHDITQDRNYDVWDLWEDGDYEEFTSAIDCIAHLPKLQAVHIRFSDRCTGDPDHDYYWECGIESVSTRLHTLEAVFRAMQTRATREAGKHGNPVTSITSLTIQNLQNIPIPDFVSSDSFRSVAKGITKLRLLVAEEYNEAGPDYDLDCVERRTFEPWLQNSFLPLFANQLTSLHLAFNEHWGVAPGYFDGKNLFFPNLKTLTLGNFVIGHHNQFDWVLAQKSLETLRLNQCAIVSYLTFLHQSGLNQGQLRDWNTPIHDWKQYPEWSFGFDEGMSTFSFPGTWEAVFDSIRAELPNLVDFRMENPSRAGNHFNSAEYMRCMLTCLRYTTLDTGLLPSPWIQADDFTGKMHFGNNDPAVLPPEDRGKYQYVEKAELNRAKETLAGDLRAFKALVRAVEERRRQRGFHQIST